MRNQDRRPRAIVIEHPVRDGWKLAGNRPPVESTASAYRFQVGVPAGETAMLVVDEVRLDPMEVAITDVDGEFLSVALQGTDQQPAVERMLKPVFDERRAIAELTASIATRNSEITTIRTDQARLRENMAALQRSSRERRLLERYLRQLDEQETRLDTLKQEIARLTSQQQAAERRLADTIRTLELDLMF
jgi:predicted RNase H-like nuclease (RuvC/YqgF family)